MDVRVVLAPYDAGRRSARMGGGPEHLAENGLTDALEADGLNVALRVAELEGDDLRAEVSAAFELDGLISREVRSGVEEGEFPLVLSGNCNSCVGTLAGAGRENLGVVWFDGHADFHTPETTTSGFTDCMGLSIAVGHCWDRMSAQVQGYAPVPEENVVLVGTREIEPGERERLHASDVIVVAPGPPEDGGILGKLCSALFELRERVQGVYLHLDLDVLDPGSVGKANEFAPAGGLTAEETERAIRLVRERVGVVAAGIASYDPATDHDGAVLQAGVRLARALVD